MHLARRVALFSLGLVLLACPARAEDNLRTAAQTLDTSVSNNALTFTLMANEAVMAVNVTGVTAAGAILTIEGSSDARKVGDANKVWFSTVAMPFTCPSPATFTTVAADEPFKMDVSGLTDIRFRVSTTGTGNAVVGLNAIPGATMGTCGGTGGSGGGGGGGGPITGPLGTQTLAASVAVTTGDGNDVAEGATGATAYAGSGSTTVIGGLKGLYNAAALGTGAFGSATPTSGVAIGGTDGTNLREIAVDTTGHPILGAGTNTVGGVTAVLGTTNGWTGKMLNALTVSNAIKTGAGELGMLQCYNPNATVIYVQVWDNTTATTTEIQSWGIAPNAPGGFALSNPGINFATGLTVQAATTATGSSAPSTAPDCNVAYH